MKKLLVALDGLKFSESVAKFAVQLAVIEKAHLVGVFLESFDYTSYSVSDLVHAKGGLIGSAKRKFDKKDGKARALAVNTFEEICRKTGISFSVHRDRNVEIRELIHESKFADLLIIDPSETFSRFEENSPTKLVRDVLAKSECPVLEVPASSVTYNKIVLLYDGTATSLHAIKMLAYVMPSSANYPVELIVTVSEDEAMHIPYKGLLNEFTSRHFSNIQYTVLKGNTEQEVIRHLSSSNDNPLIVLGAYCRGRLSRWVRPSLADIRLTELKMPLFIAHK